MNELEQKLALQMGALVIENAKLKAMVEQGAKEIARLTALVPPVEAAE